MTPSGMAGGGGAAANVLSSILGGGGGGAGGGFMTARGTANLLTRVTAILAACFFATSLVLAIMAGAGRESVSIIDEVINETPAPSSGPAVPSD